jgi:hypothetical protein
MAVLSDYMSDLENLIQAPTSPIPLVTAALRQHYINKARGQCAAQGDNLPGYGTLAVSQASNQYPFASITFPASAGIKSAIAIETVNWLTPQGGQLPVNPIEWARYNRYELAHRTPVRTSPRVWSELQQGDLGTMFLNPLDNAYTLAIRARCIPVDLVDDNTPDAIPYGWSDAVPFLAAWYCYMSLQRQADADKMLERYQGMMQVGRGGAVPDTQAGVFNGSPDIYMAGRLGMGGGGGGPGQGRTHPRQSSPPTAA